MIDGGSAFTEYSSLESLDLGLVQAIGNYAFYYCESFKSISISDSPLTINDMAFTFCLSLTEITFNS